jgi:hypothetical protein
MAGRAILVRVIGALAALTAMAATAHAQSAVCMDLEARLANLQNPSTGGGSRQLDESINRQRIELSQARNEARRANCSGGFLFFQQNRHPMCGSLIQTIGRMEQNLARLEGERDRIWRQSQGSPAEVQNVLRLLASNNCGSQYARYGGSRWSNDSGGGFFGPRSWWNSGPFSGWGQAPRVNTFRTLCVRTCDGYYFPISFSTVNSRFAEDEATCRSMCPGTDVQLYIHHNPGEESEQMVSLAGEPYTVLPTAFLYRDHYIDACSCGRPIATDYAALGEQPATIAGVPVTTEVAVRSFVPIPAARPDPSEDPDTVANRQGAFVPEPQEAKVPGAVAELTGPDGKRIRVVGPSYYYAQ